MGEQDMHEEENPQKKPFKTNPSFFASPNANPPIEDHGENKKLRNIDNDKNDAEDAKPEKTPEQIRQEDRERVAGFRLIDDIFARFCFRGRPDLAEFVLRIITGIEDLSIDREDYETQYDAKRLAGSRSLVMDIKAGDTGGKKYNIEIENWDASPERAEFHVAAMIMEYMPPNSSFGDLPEIYVIFICGTDVLGRGEARSQFSYREDGKSQECGKAGRPHASMGGRTHIIYVNGAYQGMDTEIGKLVHDFGCRDAKDMHFPILAERVRTVKGNAQEVDRMCQVIEDIRKESEEKGRREGRREGLQKGRREGAMEMLFTLIGKRQLSMEEAFNALQSSGISAEEFKNAVEGRTPAETDG